MTQETTKIKTLAINSISQKISFSNPEFPGIDNTNCKTNRYVKKGQTILLTYSTKRIMELEIKKEKQRHFMVTFSYRFQCSNADTEAQFK